MVHLDADEALDALRDGPSPTASSAPHPHPSRGAGGPHQRAAGRVSERDAARRCGASRAGTELRAAPGTPSRPAAVLLEPDPLLRLAAEQAVRRLGFEPGISPARVVFVNLGGLGACPVSPGAAGVVVGYVVAQPLTGAVHALHECCAQVLELRALRDGPAFIAALVPSHVAAACLTARETDVLALILAGATDRGMAAALGVEPSTVRSHARALLRKLGVSDRAELRRLDRAPAAVLGAVAAVPAGDGRRPCALAASGLHVCGAEVRRDSPHGRAAAARR